MLGVKVFVSSEQVSDLLEHHKSELLKLTYKFPVGKLMGMLCTYCMYYKKIILEYHMVYGCLQSTDFFHRIEKH